MVSIAESSSIGRIICQPRQGKRGRAPTANKFEITVNQKSEASNDSTIAESGLPIRRARKQQISPRLTISECRLSTRRVGRQHRAPSLTQKSTLCPFYIREGMQGSCSFIRARYARPTSEKGRKALAYSLEHTMPVPQERGNVRLLLSHKSTLYPCHIREGMQGSCSFTRVRYARPTLERGRKALAHLTSTPCLASKASSINHTRDVRRTIVGQFNRVCVFQKPRFINSKS